MKEKFENEVRQCLKKGELLLSEPMSRHTTFRIGGKADYFVEPGTEKELIEVLNLCRSYELPYYICGNGSNLLVSDKGFRGVIFCIGRKMSEITLAMEEDSGVLTAQAGILLSRLSATAAEHGLEGLAFAGGIPGTLGGAVMMNAGAYGGEIKDTILWARILWTDGTVEKVSKEELSLSYRKSILEEKPGVVLEAAFRLKKGRKEDIIASMNDFNQRRKDKQPLNYPSAGSTFKRPEGYFAGKLIMDAGLRGLRIGDACVSEKHCGFVVNMGKATAEEVKELMEEVERTVFEKYGVRLTPEVRFVGEW
jgi:UDP-N-acetylmuramate dehydrogenase